jgi:hypothetical protein
MHPSELPSFESLSATRKQVRSRLARAIATVMLAALVIGGAGLASTRGVRPVNNAMPGRVVIAVKDLPVAARQAAAHTVDLTITTPGHVTNVAAMVLPDNLAVTTTPVPHNALLTASIPSHLNFPVTWIGRDKTLGFSIVRLGIKVPALQFAPLPANASVIAVSPIMTGSVKPPHFAWANTTLGDPEVLANGVVSYLATPPYWNLNGFVDAVAVNSKGQVVAVLSTKNQWFSAQFVARVANIVATGNGCHSSLNIKGADAQGGGVLVRSVARRGASTNHLNPGDVVIKLDGHAIDSWNTLLTLLYLTPAGTPAELTYLRGSSTQHTEVILACAL